MPTDAESILEVVSASASPLVVADAGPVRVLVLNAPARRNALSVDMRQALADASASIRADPEVRAVVVTGASGTFCSGLDLTEKPPSDGSLAVEPHPAAAIASLGVPSIAAVDGFCLTGGSSSRSPAPSSSPPTGRCSPTHTQPSASSRAGG